MWIFRLGQGTSTDCDAVSFDKTQPCFSWRRTSQCLGVMLYCTLHCSQLLLGSSGVGDLSQICSRAGLDGDHQYIHALLIYQKVVSLACRNFCDFFFLVECLSYHVLG